MWTAFDLRRKIGPAGWMRVIVRVLFVPPAPAPRKPNVGSLRCLDWPKKLAVSLLHAGSPLLRFGSYTFGQPRNRETRSPGDFSAAGDLFACDGE
jgi:hypothetical protein